MKNLIFTTVFTLATITSLYAQLNPQSEYEFTPDMFGMQYEEVKIETDDKLKLTGWMISPMSKSKKVMVILHGGDGNMADYLDVAGQFVSLKYNVLLFDYRGFGTSEDGGLKISPKFYTYSQFVLDAQAALNYVRKYHAVYSVDMFGTGMGAGLAVAVAANRNEINYVIADGAYPSLENVQNAWEEANGEKIFVPFGYDKGWMEPLFALEDKGDHLEGVLLIVSENDPIINTEDADMIKEKNKKKVQIYSVNSETNDGNFDTNKDAYFTAVKNFLK